MVEGNDGKNQAGQRWKSQGRHCQLGNNGQEKQWWKRQQRAMMEKSQGGHCPLGNNGQERQSWQQGNGGKGSKAMMEGSLV